MDLELLGSLGWREALIAIIVLLVAYIIVIFLRMRRLQGELRGAAVPPLAVQSALAAYGGIQDAMPTRVVRWRSTQPPGKSCALRCCGTLRCACTASAGGWCSRPPTWITSTATRATTAAPTCSRCATRATR